MTCPKCGSSNVSFQVVTTSELRNRHHGFLWWLCIGWWWVPLKWIVLTIPALLAAIFIPKRQKIKQTQSSVCVCQNCGHRWNA